MQRRAPACARRLHRLGRYINDRLTRIAPLCRAPFGSEERSPLKRHFYKPLGLLFLVLGAIGIVLPVLPSTPFVLLAAWFFARSSRKWHARLLASELFGPMIRNWEANRCISLRTKMVGLAGMAIAGSASIALALDDPTLKIAAAGLLAVGATTLLCVKTCPDCRGPRNARHGAKPHDK